MTELRRLAAMEGGVVKTEHEDRLRSMLADSGQTWDLSKNDKLAIQWALEEMESLRVVNRRLMAELAKGAPTDAH
jgi:hypothetical protein